MGRSTAHRAIQMRDEKPRFTTRGLLILTAIVCGAAAIQGAIAAVLIALVPAWFGIAALTDLETSASRRERTYGLVLYFVGLAISAAIVALYCFL